MTTSRAIEGGGIYRARPMDPRQPAALVLATDVMDERDVAVTLLSPDMEFGTSLDIPLTPADTGLAYSLLAQSDVFGYIPPVQLDRHLGTVNGAVLDALAALRNEDAIDFLVGGPPVLHRDDPRWGFKASELARLRSLSAPYAPVQREYPLTDAERDAARFSTATITLDERQADA